MNYFFFPTSNGLRGYYKKRHVSVFVDENGKKKIDSKSTKNPILINIPFLRGIVFFSLGLVALLGNFKDSVKEQIEDGLSQKIAKKLNVTRQAVAYTAVCIISLIFALFLLGYVPSKLSFLLLGFEKNFYLRNLVIASVKLALILLCLLVLRFIPSMQEIYRFNGAGNLASKNKGEFKENSKLEHHSALNFLNFLLFSFLLSSFVVTLVGISVNFWANWLINIAIFLGVTSISYEILWLLSKNKKLEYACILTSFFVTMKPRITHDEVARVTYTQLNMKEKFFGDSMEKGKIERATVLAEMQTKLSKAGKYEKSDVDWIIATTLGKNREEAKLVRFFDEKTYREIMKATEQRSTGMPLSAIFGFVEFYGLKFDVNKKVLSPRMETEILVEEVLKAEKEIKKCEILDVGTGSGAIAVAIAKNSASKVSALDVSKGALEVAKQNARNNDVKIEFLQSNLLEGLKKSRKFDIIVSNPPYIRSLDLEGLDEEVKKYDPRLALDGGEDGLDFYREIIKEAPFHLKKSGKIFFEIGKGQFADVKKLLEQGGFVDIKGIKDYNKIYRVVKAEYGNGKRDFRQNKKNDRQV